VEVVEEEEEPFLLAQRARACSIANAIGPRRHPTEEEDEDEDEDECVEAGRVEGVLGCAICSGGAPR
jgi:hypothetical protein